MRAIIGWWAQTAGSVILGASLLCSVRVLAESTARPEQIELRTEIFGLAGLHVATSRTRIETTRGRYSIAADVESRGLATLVTDLMSHSEVTGTLGADGPRPLAYRGDVQRGGDKTGSWVDYRPDGSAVGGSSAPPATAHALPAGAIADTIDQLTAFYAMERKLAYFGSCQLDLTVFDGRRLYKLHFSDAGSEVMKPSDSPSFAGTTRLCRFERQAIAGFRDTDGHSEGVYRGELWCALFPGQELAIPVRMKLATEFGSLLGELAELRTAVADLRFRD